jgi:hypothetical protein
MTVLSGDNMKPDPEHNEVEESQPDDTIDWTPEEEKKLLRKIDLYLLPTIWSVLSYTHNPFDIRLIQAAGSCIYCHTW